MPSTHEPVCCVEPLSLDALARAAAQLQTDRDSLVEIRLHPNEYADLLRIGPLALHPDDVTTLVTTGLWPEHVPLLGATVTRDPNLEPGTVVLQGKHGGTAHVLVYR